MLEGLVVESTYNWYWLVDGLMEAGFGVHLANTAAIKQYEGLKHTDDRHDARWLAHLLRLNILPEGYIYPKQARAVRDLLRRRHRLVRERVANLLSIQNQFARMGMNGFSAARLKRLQDCELDRLIADGNVRSAVAANLALVRCLNLQIERLEREVLAQVKLAAQFEPLMSITGIGKILALTIMLETGRSHALPKSASSPPTRVVLTRSASPTRRRRGRTTPSAAIRISPGRSWRRPISPSATHPGSSVSSTASAPGPTRSWPSRPARTSSRGRPFT
jgi:transposase